MKKLNKSFKSLIFISIWLIFSSYLINFWNTFHWKYIYLNLRLLFDREFWIVLEKTILGIDLGYFLEESLRYLSYEIPKESLKYIPIYYFLKSTWIKR